jgi:hypothetical protein
MDLSVGVDIRLGVELMFSEVPLPLIGHAYGIITQNCIQMYEQSKGGYAQWLCVWV